jgi:hypothetical protein
MGFAAAQLLLWCASSASQAQTPADPYAYSRTSDFSYRSDGLLTSETIEPGLSQLCVSTTYTYDGYGNKSAATTAQCAGAAGLAQIASRTSSTTYVAQNGRLGNAGGTQVPIPAGTFATSAANALSQSETRIYDPRFGVPVSLTGPNALTTTWALDDFGRKVLESRADGTKTAMYYCWVAVNFNGVVISTASNSPNCHSGSAPHLTLVPAPVARPDSSTAASRAKPARPPSPTAACSPSPPTTAAAPARKTRASTARWCASPTTSVPLSPVVLVKNNLREAS